MSMSNIKTHDILYLLKILGQVPAATAIGIYGGVDTFSSKTLPWLLFLKSGKVLFIHFTTSPLN